MSLAPIPASSFDPGAGGWVKRPPTAPTLVRDFTGVALVLDQVRRSAAERRIALEFENVTDYMRETLATLDDAAAGS